MRITALTLLASTATLLLAHPSLADMTFTVTKDSTMDGNAGKLMSVSEPGYPDENWFGFVEGDLVRVYAHRDHSVGTWTVPTLPIYFVPDQSISAGQTWAFLPEEGTPNTVAEAITLEQKTVGAGTFTCWRVDVTPAGDPGTLIARYWFALNVGMIAQVEYAGGQPVWRVELDSYTVNGSGYFPLILDNTWAYVGFEVANTQSSVGELKTRYANGTGSLDRR